MSKLIARLELLALEGSESEKRIAAQLLRDDIDIAEMSAISLGNLCNVSNASIVRFTQSIGFKGYSAFKFDFLPEQKARLERLRYRSPSEAFSPRGEIERASFLLNEQLNATFERLNEEHIASATKMLLSAERIAIIAHGQSSLVALHLSQRLMKLNCVALFQSDQLWQQTYLEKLTEGDLVLLLSGREELAFNLPLFELARLKCTKLVSITPSDCNLEASSLVQLPFCYNQTGIDSSQVINQLAVLDIVLEQMVRLMR